MKCLLKYFFIAFHFSSLAQNLLPGFPHSELNRKKDVDLHLKIPRAKRLVQIDHYLYDTMNRIKVNPVKEYFFYSDGSVKKLNLKANHPGVILSSYDFDEYGRITHEKREDGTMAHYSYDEGNLTSTSVSYSKDSVKTSKSIIYYNKDLKMIRHEWYKDTSTLAFYRTYEYNSRGDLTCEIFVNTPNGPGVTIDFNSYYKFTPTPNDTAYYFITYGDTLTVHEKHLDEKIIKKYQVNDTLITIENKFYKSGDTLKKIIKEAGKYKKELQLSSFGRSVLCYYDDELTLFESWRNEKLAISEKYTYKYKTDSKNNWTTKLTSVNGKPYHKIERIIIYNKN